MSRFANQAEYGTSRYTRDEGTGNLNENTSIDAEDSVLFEFSVDQPVLLRRDSDFSAASSYDYGSSNDLSVWQGAALLTADCLGTGILALPADIKVLGATLGFGFLIAQLPINLYAGTILSHSASGVEERQQVENRLFAQSQSLPSFTNPNTTDYRSINQNTADSTFSKASMITIDTRATNHTQLHHDTATFDFIGMTQALFRKNGATRVVMLIYYTNIFLVLGNYILVMSHAVAAMVGEDYICLPTAGLVASIGMFALSQLRTMSKLGRTVSILSLSALFIVVVQCLIASNSNGVPFRSSKTADVSVLAKLSAFGSIGFAVGSQKLFLNIRHELDNRKTAPKSLAISLSAFGTLYVAVILIAGDSPPDFLFDAIPSGLNRRVAGFLLWAHVAVSYAINSQAICSSLDRLVFYRIVSDSVSAEKRWLLLTFLMATAAYIVANAIPFFKDLVAFIGAITSVPLTLLLPAVFWRKHLHEPIWVPTMTSMYSYGLLLFAVLFMVSATIGSLWSIRNDWSEHGPPFSCD